MSRRDDLAREHVGVDQVGATRREQKRRVHFGRRSGQHAAGNVDAVAAPGKHVRVTPDGRDLPAPDRDTRVAGR